MKEEKIIRFGRLAYARLRSFNDDYGSFNFKDKSGEYEAERIFWRIYWLTKVQFPKL
jgi:hypothetical protein